MLRDSVITGRKKVLSPSFDEQVFDVELGSSRIGCVIGEHKITFASAGEIVQFSHSAQNRDDSSRGALHAAKWVRGRPAGLYDMTEIFGLNAMECG